jgi:hypothetical protein
MALPLPDLTAWGSDDFGAAASVGTLLVALAATLIARRQLIQARELREEEAAPFVNVDVMPGARGWMLDLVIENIGKTLARDVCITFDPPLVTTLDDEDDQLADWSPLKDGVRTLAPGRRLTSIFDSALQRHESDLPRQYEVTVAYTDSRGRHQPTLQQTIDLNPIYGRTYSHEKGLPELVAELAKVRSAIEPITKKRLRVQTYDGPAEDARAAVQREEWQKQVASAEARRLAEAQDPTGGDGPPST